MSIFSRLFERKNNLTVSSDIKKEDARSRNIAFVDTENAIFAVNLPITAIGDAKNVETPEG